jgi:molybdenum cofactor cytidylyltransferase
VIRGLLLCGGTSSRFGSDKLLHRHSPAGESAAEAQPLVVRSARHLIEGAGNALAVIPMGASALRLVLEQAGCEILESPQTLRGLGASLAAGVAHTRTADAWIVALGDMPSIRTATIAAVRAKLEGGALIAAPFIAATHERGHPVGFSRALRDELLVVDGDEGARSVIARHRAAVVSIPVDDRGILFDVDTRGDLDAATSA